MEFFFPLLFVMLNLVTNCAKCHMSRYLFAHHNLTVSAGDRGNGMWKWECGQLRPNNQGYTHFQLNKTEAGDTQRQRGRAMLKDILPCPFELGQEIDIFQSDEALMWVIQPLHHCDMRLLANAHPCWWAHPTPQGPWPTYPPSSLSISLNLSLPSLFFYFHRPSPLFSVTMSCPITVWLARHSVGQAGSRSPR